MPEILLAPGVPKRYDSENLHSEGRLRAEMLTELLSQHGVPLTQGHMLDLGCGYGGLSLYAAERGATVTSIDSSDHKIATLTARLSDEDALTRRRVRALSGSATDLPLDSASVDQAFTLGVIEWVPLVTPGADPQSIQLEALREIARVVKPGGTYILGTKNRWFPVYTLREAQVRKRLINALPRPLARSVSRAVYHRDYRTYIHSESGWRDMLLEAGFHSVETFLPVYFYQFPLDLWRLGSKRNDLRAALTAAARRVSPDYYRLAMSGHSRAKEAFLSAMIRAGLEHLFWPAFIFVARR